MTVPKSVVRLTLLSNDASRVIAETEIVWPPGDDVPTVWPPSIPDVMHVDGSVFVRVSTNPIGNQVYRLAKTMAITGITLGDVT